MSLKSVHQKLTTLADEPSNNAKKELLEEYLEDTTFRRVVWCTLTNTVQFNIKKFPPFDGKKQASFTDRSNKKIFAILKRLSQQKGASSADKKELFDSASIDKETYEVVRRICNSDLACGVGASLVNNVRPGTIKKMPYQRCKTSKHISNIVFEPEAIIQTKADGGFCNLHIKKEDYKIKMLFQTRSGQTIKCLQHLKKQMLYQPPKLKYGKKYGLENCDKFSDHFDKTYMGELRVWEVVGKKIMSRKKGNGIINQCIQGTCPPELAKKVFFTVWDVVPTKKFWEMLDDTPYQSRFFEAAQLTHTVGNENYVRTIESKRVKNLDEAYEFYREQRKKGEEGAILKNLSAIWRDQQSGSPDLIKLKHVFEVDLVIVGWNYGEENKANAERMGSVDCESACGKLKVNIGTGFSQEEREWDWDMMIDCICSVEAESVSKAKNKTLYSLYTPSFIEPREDKETANTLEEIIEIEETSKRSRRNR